MRRRDVFTKVRTTLKELFLKSRKEHLVNDINNLLRNKFIDEIDVSTSLFFFQRVEVLLSTLIVKEQISLTLKKKNIRLNNIERNIAKIIITLISYVVATKTNAQREIDATTTMIITLYNNINQQKQLKKAKKRENINFQDQRAKRKE
jgi:ABC-type transport system involved in cytochrome bd biosynthesis fused ATPase/permease subunit